MTARTTLRARLFLLFGGLAVALLGAQWWWMQSLTSELANEVDAVALAVGNSVATFLTAETTLGTSLLEHQSPCDGGADCEEQIEILTTTPGSARVRVERRLGIDGTTSGAGHLVRRIADAEGREIEIHVVRGVNAEDGPIEPPITVHEHADSVRTDSSDGADSSEQRAIVAESRPNMRFLWLTRDDDEARVPIPDQGFANLLERFRQRLILGSSLLLAVGLVAAGWLAHRVTRPLRRLASASAEVGAGAYGVHIDEPRRGGGTEIDHAITAFNAMSSQLRELDAERRRLSADRHLSELGEVARGLAHSLRNPLNALGLSIDQLAADDDNASAELARSARRQIRRLDRSIRSFLVLASPGGGLESSEVDVLELARDVGLEALHDAPPGVGLDVDGDSMTLPAVEPELRAMVQALVVNAVEAASPTGRVEIYLEPIDGERLRVVIDDDGPGIGPEIRARLFTPHASTKDHGSGMGLFLAQRLASNRYQGSVELIDRRQSEGHAGTRAVLEIGPRVQT